MIVPFVRYEILLPLKYNDGTPVESEKFEQVRKELLRQFEGLTINSGTIEGLWLYQGEMVEDELIRIIIDAEETIENERFFHEFKERLKEKFRQVEIWITVQPLKIL